MPLLHIWLCLYLGEVQRCGLGRWDRRAVLDAGLRDGVGESVQPREPASAAGAARGSGVASPHASCHEFIHDR